MERVLTLSVSVTSLRSADCNGAGAGETPALARITSMWPIPASSAALIALAGSSRLEASRVTSMRLDPSAAGDFLSSS